VNDASITTGDISAEFGMLPVEIQRLYGTPDGAAALLEELVKKELLYQEAIKRGYQKEPDFVRQQEEFSKRLMIEFLLRDEIEQKTRVSPEAVRKFYDDNRERFVRQVPGSEEPELISFEQVEDIIRERLEGDQQREVFEGYVAGLRNSASVEVDTDLLEATFANVLSPSDLKLSE
jgi:peptidyl-prolyl cis-trans isomerase C